MTPAFAGSAHTSLDTGSGMRLISVASRRVRVPAIVSPLWCAARIESSRPFGRESTTAPVFSAAPRRGLWQPSQVRRSPGRTWIQLVWVWKPRPFSSTMDSAIGVSAGTLSLNEPSGSMAA